MSSNYSERDTLLERPRAVPPPLCQLWQQASHSLDVSLSLIPDLAPSQRAVLREAGLDAPRALVQACYLEVTTEELAAELDLDDEELGRWAGTLDLHRVPGLPSCAIQILILLGIHSTHHLATSEPDELGLKIAAVVEINDLSYRAPSEEKVAEWITAASRLPVLRWV